MKQNLLNKMKNIQIDAEKFFGKLKLQEISMWDIFEQMLGEEPQQIVFLDSENRVLASYVLPTSKEQLLQDKKSFSQSFLERLKQN